MCIVCDMEALDNAASDSSEDEDNKDKKAQDDKNLMKVLAGAMSGMKWSGVLFN